MVMLPQNPSLPHLPAEVIFLILDECRHNLETDVRNYVYYRRTIPWSRLEQVRWQEGRSKRPYLLYHEDRGYDDCVFWHQIWTYTALRRLSHFTNEHTDWAAPKFINALIKAHEDKYEADPPRDRPPQQPGPTSMRARLRFRASRLHRGQRNEPGALLLEPKAFDKAIWERDSRHVPIWEKFLEANTRLTTPGTQLLPWQSGYDKAAAFICIHVNKFALAKDRVDDAKDSTSPIVGAPNRDALPSTSYFSDKILRNPPLPHPQPPAPWNPAAMHPPPLVTASIISANGVPTMLGLNNPQAPMPASIVLNPTLQANDDNDVSADNEDNETDNTAGNTGQLNASEYTLPVNQQEFVTAQATLSAAGPCLTQQNV